MESQIPNIQGVHVATGRFTSGKDFNLFKPLDEGKHPHRVSVIFGRNGSGKTTIAEQLATIAGQGMAFGFLYDRNGSPLALSDAEKNNVRVFDEQYVRDKVYIEDDGLQTIVMLGDQVAAKTRIADLDKELIELGQRFVEYEAAKEKAESGSESVSKLEKEAKELAKQGGWSTRIASVEGGRPPLTTKHWQSIVSAGTDEGRQVLQERFDAGLSSYAKANDAGTQITARLVPAGLYDEAPLLGLLNRELDEPNLTDREKRILALVHGGDQRIVERARSEFAREEIVICPMCQQNVTREHKASLEESISKVLSREVDQYKDSLRQARLSQVREQAVPGQVSEGTRASYQSALASANAAIDAANALIARRMDSLYNPLGIGSLGVSEALQTLNTSISEINAEIDAVNKAIRNRQSMKDDLLRLNDQIAWIDCHEKVEQCGRVAEELAEAERKLDDLERKKKALEAEKGGEQAKINQTEIAAALINRYLAYVYFDANRFRLVASGGQYALESHGEPVRPQSISTGERNILALCYFFSEGGRGKFEGSEDSDPQYLIFDDPISSFDMENRVGICSLLRDRFAHILSANKESRITVLTHDASVVAELKHIFDDVQKEMKGTDPFVADCLELRDGEMRPYELQKGEYRVLLRRAYDFAISETEDDGESYVIGNILRRILEGYSTFNYGIGMAELTRDPDLCQRLGKPAKFLKSAMYRLAFNDGSHMQEKVSALNPSITFSRYSYQEKRALAQCAFVTLNELDQDHLQKNLCGSGSDIKPVDLAAHLVEWEQRFTPPSERCSSCPDRQEGNLKSRPAATSPSATPRSE